MIQKNKVSINEIRKICADYVHIVKEPTSDVGYVALLALMSFELIMDEIYGQGSRKEMMDIVEEKRKREKEAKSSKLIKP